MFNKDVTNAFASGMPENELKKIHKDFMEALNVLSGNCKSEALLFPYPLKQQQWTFQNSFGLKKVVSSFAQVTLILSLCAHIR